MERPHGFSLTRSGDLRLELDDSERLLLLSLARQVAEFVAPAPLDGGTDPLAAMVGIDATAQQPDDPALARLLPDAFRDDPEASADFRRFTERGLRDLKLANASKVAVALASGAKVVPRDDIPAWLGLLNDARLTLGTRLEVTEDNHAELLALPDEDPRAGLLDLYDWLTYLEDSLVRLLMPDAV